MFVNKINYLYFAKQIRKKTIPLPQEACLHPRSGKSKFNPCGRVGDGFAIFRQMPNNSQAWTSYPVSTKVVSHHTIRGRIYFLIINSNYDIILHIYLACHLDLTTSFIHCEELTHPFKVHSRLIMIYMLTSATQHIWLGTDDSIILRSANFHQWAS